MFKTIISILFVLIVLSIQIVPAQSAPSASPQGAMVLGQPERLLASTEGFPQHEAGLTLVANIGAIEYGRMYDAILPFVDLGDSDGTTYIWGWTKIESEVVYRDPPPPPNSGPMGPSPSWDRNATWSDDIGVYVDITGSLILFLPTDTPTARMIGWASPPDGGANVLSNKNILEQGLDIISNSFRRSFASIRDTINYIHFDYPNATSITLFTLYGCEKNISLLVPNGLTLYEISYDLLSYEYPYCTLSLNGQKIIDATATRKYTGRIETASRQPGIETGVSTSISMDGDRASAAFALLWSTEE